MKKHRRRRTYLYRCYMFLKACIAQLFFCFPTRWMVCIWITGTDGKSTTSEMTYHILQQAWYRVGLLTTTSIDVGAWKHQNMTKLTSLSHRDFAKLCKQARDNGYTHMVIEVSSHALYQWRTRPVRFHAVALTNITREHLDFHRTMEHYARTKCALFSRVDTTAWGCYIQDMPYEKILHEVNNTTLTCCWYDASCTVRADSITQTPRLSYTLHRGDELYQVDTLLLGRFNIDNSMLACSLASQVGIQMWDAVDALVSFTWVAGRQQLLSTKDDIHVMIDFALTPDALVSLYTSVRELWFARSIAVFGATWNRDQGKRPQMWEIATRLCDQVVLTEDENYHEVWLEIIQDIVAGIPADRTNWNIVQERKAAIAYAVEQARSWDIIIVTGMADFTTRSMNEWVIPWCEEEVIREVLGDAGKELIDS